MMHSIYLITNKSNGKVYVGKTTKTIDERFEQHLADARRGDDRRLYQAIRKHGVQAFAVSLLEIVEDKDASAAEIKSIADRQSKDWKFGYNMTDGGEGRSGCEVLPETIEKLRKAGKERTAAMSIEQRTAMTAAANQAKLGKKERPSQKKKDARQATWDAMTEEQRAERGRLSREGISEEGKARQAAGMNNAFSPVRQKGYKQPIVTCPHCSKTGGLSAMKKYHFGHCKLK